MISYDLLKDIENYANRHMDSSKEFYLSRNQKLETMFMQCFNGKVAEWNCYFSMKDAGYILEKPPCMQIFSQANKSYESDLICIGKENLIYDNPRYIHIKSISLDTYKNIGASALVQKNDPIIQNPHEDHYFSFMLQESLLVYKFYKWVNSLNIQLGEPKAKHLAASKYAIYLD